MHTLSDEQQYIHLLTKQDINVIVEAVAGAGKTTAILMIAKESPTKKILQLTYNASLRLEVKSRVKENNLTNVSVHTFHSLAKRYYDTPGFTTDTELRAIIRDNKPPKEPIPHVDMVVPDECQDMTLLYFRFLVKFIRDMGSPIQLLILGDSMQGLYEFKGADTRFLTLAEQIWREFPLLKTQTFVKATMKMSYRITHQICSFVNTVMLGEPRMKACRDDMKVVYIRNVYNNILKIVFAEIQKLFQQGAKPGDIFILGSSLKTTNFNIHKLENMLVKNNVPCYFPSPDNDKIDDRVIEGKVVFSTFHCVKGRQRKYVFVVGFDQSYFRYAARNKSEDVCPNTLYVAATRSIHGLFLLESGENHHDKPLSFLKMDHMEMKQQPYIDFRGYQKTLFEEIRETIKPFENVTPTELIKFQDSTIEYIAPLLESLFVKESEAESELDIPNVIETNSGFFEEVSDINGIAIPAMYFDSLYNECSPSEDRKKQSLFFNMVRSQLNETRSSEHVFLKKSIQEIPETMETIDDYLFLANIQLAMQEKLYFKLKQISPKEHHWIPKEWIKTCHDRMDRVIRADCRNGPPIVEKNLFDDKEDESHVLIDASLESIFRGKRFRFQGRVDLITDTTVWEIKCTGNLSVEHMLQLVIYKWLWDVSLNPPRQFKLFNIKTGEILRLEATEEELHVILIALLKGRYQEMIPKEDPEFIAECRESFIRE